MAGDEILTVEEIAARLKLRESWVYSHAESLGGYKLGKYWRFLWSRVMTAIEGSQSLAPKPKDPKQLIDDKSLTKRLEQTCDEKN